MCVAGSEASSPPCEVLHVLSLSAHALVAFRSSGVFGSDTRSSAPRILKVPFIHSHEFNVLVLLFIRFLTVELALGMIRVLFFCCEVANSKRVFLPYYGLERQVET